MPGFKNFATSVKAALTSKALSRINSTSALVFTWIILELGGSNGLSSLDPAGLHQTVVLTHQQLGFDLLQRV